MKHLRDLFWILSHPGSWKLIRSLYHEIEEETQIRTMAGIRDEARKICNETPVAADSLPKKLTACLHCGKIVWLEIDSDPKGVLCPRCKNPIHGEKL